MNATPAANIAVVNNACRKAYLRLLPLLFVCYVIAYIDRVNVGFAKLRMQRALEFSDTVFGLGMGIFFIGYLLLEIPGTLLVERWSARKWISRIMISWGVLAACTAWVSTPWQFYTIRFLLGVAEAGFFPGIIVYLTHWFPKSDRTKALAWFFIGTPVAQIIAPPVSAYIMDYCTDKNLATVRAPAGIVDPIPANNSAEDNDTSVARNPIADLAVSITNNRSSSERGDAVVYTVTLTNKGPSDVQAAKLTSDFPSLLEEVRFMSSTKGQATASRDEGHDQLDETVDLSAGSSVQYEVHAKVGDGKPKASSAKDWLRYQSRRLLGQSHILASVSVEAPHDITDPQPNNNTSTDSDDSTNQSHADLSIAVTEPASISPKQHVTYIVTVKNLGPSDVVGAVIDAQFPAMLTNVNYTSSSTGTVSGPSASGTGNVKDTVNMSVGATIKYTVTGVIADTADGHAGCSVSIVPPSSTSDAKPENNSVGRVADLAVSKSDKLLGAVGNQEITTVTTVRNNGPNDVLGAKFTDRYPGSLTGLAFTSEASGGATGNSTSGTGEISDTLDLPAGSSVTYTVTGKVAATANGLLTEKPIKGLVGWQWVYVFWGLPAVLLGVIVLAWLTDRPHQATWLTEEERTSLEATLNEERNRLHAHGGRPHMTIGEALSNRKVVALAFAYFFVVTGNYGVELYMASILEDWYKLVLKDVAYLVIIPPIGSMIGQLLVGWSSDRSGERRFHSTVPIVLGAIALASVPFTQGNKLLTVALFTVAMTGLKAYLPAFWSLPSLFLTASAAAASIGMINSFGNLGGWVGPTVIGFIKERFNSYAYGLWFLAGSMLVSATIILGLRIGKPKSE